MSERRTRRQRAVRLTDEALELLQQRLDEQWSEEHLEGRLTRGARAAMLELNKSTADNVFAQKGNDRSVLEQTFRAVGLPWKEEYCAPLSEDDKTDADVSVSSSSVERRTVGKGKRRPATLFAIASSILLVCLTIWTLRTEASNPPGNGSAYAAGDNAGTRWPRNAYHLAWRAYHEGKYEEARRLLMAAKTIAVAAQDTAVVAESIRLEGELFAVEGRLEKAIDCFQRALSIRREFQYGQARASVLEVLGVAQFRLGRFDEAERNLRTSFDLLKRYEDIRGMAGTARSLGTLAALRGDRAKAREWFAAALASMKSNPDPGLLLDLKAQRAVLDAEEGRHDEALRDLRECLAEWQSRGHVRWSATTLKQLATVLHMAGRKTEAFTSAEAARQKFEAVGDRLGMQKCEELLRLAERSSETFIKQTASFSSRSLS